MARLPVTGIATSQTSTTVSTSTAVTQPVGDNTTKIATTAFVRSEQTVVQLDNYLTGGATLATAFQNAINSAQSTTVGGKVVLTQGKTYTHTTGSVPAFAKNVPCEIDGSGATIQCSATVKQAFTIATPVAGDTFTGISIHDLTVDHVNSGGTGAVVFGTVGKSDFNLSQISIRRVNSVNVSLTAGNVMLIVQGATGARTITDVLVEDVHFSGGAFGTLVQGQGGAIGTGTTVFVDRVRVNRWFHDTTVPPTGFAASAHVQIGSTGYCGFNIYVGNGYGANSQDVGVEIDAPNRALVENVEIVNAWNQLFLYTKFREVLYPNMQEVVFRNCHATTTIARSTSPTFSALQQIGGQALGSVNWEDCTYHRNYAGGIVNLGMGEALALGNTTTFTNVTGDVKVKNFRLNIEGFTGDNGAPATWVAAGFWFKSSPTVVPTLEINGWSSTVSGTQGAQTLGFRHIVIDGACQLQLHDSLVFDHQITGQTGATELIRLGYLGASVGGRIAGLFVKRLTGTAAPVGVNVIGTATTTIPVQLLVENADFTNFTGGSGTEINFNAGQNLDKTLIRNIQLVTPLPATATSAVDYQLTVLKTNVKLTVIGKTATMPTTGLGRVWSGNSYYVKNGSAGNVNVASTGTFDGVAGPVVLAANQAAVFVLDADFTNWQQA